MQTSLDGLYFYNFLRWTACCEKESKTKSVVHERIQGGGGVQVSLTKKALTFFFAFFLVLSLFYRSQMVNFKAIYHFSRFQRGSNIFLGGPTFSRGGGPIAYSL